MTELTLSRSRRGPLKDHERATPASALHEVAQWGLPVMDALIAACRRDKCDLQLARSSWEAQIRAHFGMLRRRQHVLRR